jgi:hypothetical protein
MAQCGCGVPKLSQPTWRANNSWASWTIVCALPRALTTVVVAIGVQRITPASCHGRLSRAELPRWALVEGISQLSRTRRS